MSDPKETDYQIICPHDHIEICDRCDVLASVLADIDGALEEMSDSSESSDVVEELKSKLSKISGLGKHTSSAV